MSEGQTVTSPPLTALFEAVGAGRVNLARALSLSPAVLELLLDRASALVRSSRFEEADRLLFDLTLVDADNPIPPLLGAACLEAKKEPEAALRAYGEALERSERLGARSTAGRIRVARASVALGLGRLDLALDDLELAARSGSGSEIEAKAMLSRLAGAVKEAR